MLAISVLHLVSSASCDSVVTLFSVLDHTHFLWCIIPVYLTFPVKGPLTVPVFLLLRDSAAVNTHERAVFCMSGSWCRMHARFTEYWQTFSECLYQFSVPTSVSRSSTSSASLSTYCFLTSQTESKSNYIYVLDSVCILDASSF
jgi:hypothetical protein